MDGARLANAIAHLGCSPAGITWKSGIDVLSLGATKNGALAAEAVVLFNRTRADDFALRRKRAGHLWSKMRFLSAQLIAYLENDLWLRNARHANAMATHLASGLALLPGVQRVQPTDGNEVFVAMPEAMLDMLQAKGFEFSRWPVAVGVSAPVVRFVTSFCTTAADVDALLAAVRG
jgi:threonine aldolase